MLSRSEVTCVHVGVFPPTHNWAKILENCQAKKRPRLIQSPSHLTSIQGGKEAADHIQARGQERKEDCDPSHNRLRLENVIPTAGYSAAEKQVTPPVSKLVPAQLWLTG